MRRRGSSRLSWSSVLLRGKPELVITSSGLAGTVRKPARSRRKRVEIRGLRLATTANHKFVPFYRCWCDILLSLLDIFFTAKTDGARQVIYCYLRITCIIKCILVNLKIKIILNLYITDEAKYACCRTFKFIF